MGGVRGYFPRSGEGSLQKAGCGMEYSACGGRDRSGTSGNVVNERKTAVDDAGDGSVYEKSCGGDGGRCNAAVVGSLDPEGV